MERTPCGWPASAALIWTKSSPCFHHSRLAVQTTSTNLVLCKYLKGRAQISRTTWPWIRRTRCMILLTWASLQIPSLSTMQTSRLTLGSPWGSHLWVRSSLFSRLWRGCIRHSRRRSSSSLTHWPSKSTAWSHQARCRLSTGAEACSWQDAKLKSSVNKRSSLIR